MKNNTPIREEVKNYTTAEFIKLYMNDHNGGTPRWFRGVFFDEKEKIETILEYMYGIEAKLTPPDNK